MTQRSPEPLLRSFAHKTLWKMPIKVKVPVSACAEDEDHVIEIRVAPRGMDRTGVEVPTAQLFSAEERAILKALGSGTKTAREVGISIGALEASGHANSVLRTLLRNLVDRGILVSNSNGYSVHPVAQHLVRQALATA